MMQKILLLLILVLGASCEFAWADEDKEAEELMSLADKVYAERLEKIKEERANETSRFKLKAIARTEARENRQKEILKRKEEKASRFQKKAQQEAEAKKQEMLRKEQEKKVSRFTEKAQKKAEERALRQKLKEEKLHRNKNK